MSINTASLVRWPDLTPLPCTGMTVETDFSSWCWTLSASLTGPNAFALVTPNSFPREVMATINGQSWKFLLDTPNHNRGFAKNSVSLKGRSRSAWLKEPFAPPINMSQVDAREMVQIATQALDNTGWTLDWQLENWLIPAGLYNRQNTPIGTLIELVNTTSDGLYTDPVLQILTAKKRWPAAAWLLDGMIADVAIPESIIITLNQTPIYTKSLNGAYISGTTHGVMALVKIAGTDGAIQPDSVTSSDLLCDISGVAARQRGLNLLSDSGIGTEISVETLFNDDLGLIVPGQIISVADTKYVSRKTSVSATWSSGLQVKQTIGLERRDG